MPKIYYVPEGVESEASKEESILQISLRSGIPHTHECGGKARCSTCRILILQGIEHCCPRNPEEQRMADKLRFTKEIRLACQTKVTGDVKLRRLVRCDDDLAIVYDQLKLGEMPSIVGEEKWEAIMFADIRGFTSFAANLPAYDVVHSLNRYYRRIGAVIDRHGGIIDNYMGDGFMARFGVENRETAVLQAVRTGLEMLQEVEKLKKYFQEIYDVNFRIGIGVHFGSVVVGSIGTVSMKRTTVIGDTVNFASRVERANKLLKTSFLLSEDAYKEAKEFISVTEHGGIELQGKAGTYKLYEVLDVNEKMP